MRKPVALVTLLVIALVACARAGDDWLDSKDGVSDDKMGADVCIRMGGSCVNRANGICQADARVGAGCPSNSVCCLPYGSLCQWAGGRCDNMRNCGGNHIIDHGMPCDGTDTQMCCLPRSSANGYTSAVAAQKSLSKVEQESGGSVPTDGARTILDAMTHQGNASMHVEPTPSEIGLSVALPIIFLLVSVGFNYGLKSVNENMQSKSQKTK